MALIMHTAALILSGLFAGGAMMQTIVDHPARLRVGGGCAVNQMQKSLDRVDPYMPGLASGSAIMSFGAYITGAPINDLFAAMFFIAIGVETFTFIIPINKRIMSFEPTGGDLASTLSLMRQWGTLHAFRSAAGTLALILLASDGPFTLR